MKLYVVYRTDAWLSRSSLTLAGIYQTEGDAINAVLKNVVFERGAGYRTKREFREGIRQMLEEDGQTQGLDVNYQIEEIAKNEWID